MSNIVRARNPGEPKHLVNGDPKIIFEARIGAIVNYPMLEDRGEGYVEKSFEKYSRPPGLRIIALQDEKIYLQKEFRWEGEGFEWRLPGGKVLNSFEEFKPYLGKVLPEDIILAAAKKELSEEAKLSAQSWKIFKRDICGTTVEWDLHYIIAEQVETNGDRTSLEGAQGEGEHISETQWFTLPEVLDMCKRGDIGEGRTVAALLQFISQK